MALWDMDYGLVTSALVFPVLVHMLSYLTNSSAANY